jgi:hypothetical protein
VSLPVSTANPVTVFDFIFFQNPEISIALLRKDNRAGVMHRSHINTKYDEELSLLKQKILRMGELVENNVVSAIS